MYYARIANKTWTPINTRDAWEAKKAASQMFPGNHTLELVRADRPQGLNSLNFYKRSPLGWWSPTTYAPDHREWVYYPK